MILKVTGIIIMVIYSCGFNNKHAKEKSQLRAIRVTQNFPYVNNQGKLLGYDSTSVNIYYFGDQVMYSDFYQWDSLVQGVSVKTEIRQNFFVFEKGKAHGFFYDKHKSEFDRKVLIDSMLQQQWYNQTGYLFDFEKLQLAHYNTDSGILSKKYDTKGTRDTTMKGSAFLQFSNKLTWTDYSLAKIFDTITGMKLCRINTTTNSRYLKDHNITLDTITQIFYMEEIAINNEKEILYYFDREKKFNKKD